MNILSYFDAWCFFMCIFGSTPLLDKLSWILSWKNLVTQLEAKEKVHKSAFFSKETCSLINLKRLYSMCWLYGFGLKCVLGSLSARYFVHMRHRSKCVYSWNVTILGLKLNRMLHSWSKLGSESLHPFCIPLCVVKSVKHVLLNFMEDLLFIVLLH